jgi:hypothetical protein
MPAQLGFGAPELICSFGTPMSEMKEIKAKDGGAFVRNYPMSFKFLEALDAQNKVAKRRGVRQIIRVYGIDAGNRHHDNG